MSFTGTVMFQSFSLIVSTWLILSLASGIEADSSIPSQDQQRQTAFTTYDFNNDEHLNQAEFTTFYLSLFGADEKRFVTPSTTRKLFQYLDIDNDGRLNSEEFRKAFQRWFLPIVNTKSCLFLCVQRDSVNATDLEIKSARLIEQSQALFKVHYVYVSSCNAESREKEAPIAQLVQHVQKALPKAYDIKMYSVDSHLESLKNKNFDQFIINFANIKHDRNSLRELMLFNSAKQLPTAIVADQHDRQLLGDYLDEQHLHSSVVVNSSLSAKERARYKTELSLILARKIYRQYKKLIH